MAEGNHFGGTTFYGVEPHCLLCRGALTDDCLIPIHPECESGWVDREAWLYARGPDNQNIFPSQMELRKREGLIRARINIAKRKAMAQST